MQVFTHPMVLMIPRDARALQPRSPAADAHDIAAALFGTLGYMQHRTAARTARTEEEDVTQALAEEKRKPENVMSLLHVGLIELEFGYGILPLVDASQEYTRLDRVVMIRRQCAMELGIIVLQDTPRDNIQLGTSQVMSSRSRAWRCPAGK